MEIVLKQMDLGDPDDAERKYWLSRTPEERIRAVEEFRREYHSWRYKREPRLRRVYRVTELSRS
jgi:hypothetical protein